jgi:type I restriction-modification system DNA methylase subunit
MTTLLATDLRIPIAEALSAFPKQSLADGSRSLFSALGYSSERRITLAPNTAGEFVAQFGALNADKAMTADWLSVDFLFQLTDEEIGNHFAFSTGQVDRTVIESYIFLAIHLKESLYTRGRLATIAREINKLFPMPVMVLFRHGDSISLAVIDRELNKRDSSKDVLRKVTLIKDMRLAEPGRAHIEILNELSLPVLYNEYPFHNFVELHRAWAKKLDSSDLNKRFYQEVSYWYLWAKNHADVKLPKDVDSSSDEQRSIFFIRLLTRLIFCWFLQEKGLIPRRLFQAQYVREFLKDSSPEAGTYYQAVLQNLFFATLNREKEKRGFRDKKTTGRFDKNRGVTTLYRYEDLLSDKAALLKLFDTVPFVNGGLFDCLDDVYRKAEGQPSVRLDGFSDNPRESLTLPNELFFGREQHVDLSHEFDDKRKDDVSVRPFIEILSRYKFTVEENTPLEQEIALDPELLGKVFENLLASYNDDTKTIARKKVGAFYTPRDVVRYMVDESLIFHFASVVPESKLRRLLADQSENNLTPAEMEKLIAAIEKTRILDPACGSGAFPMGALNRLVHLLSILDPNNASWKRRQREAALRDRERAEAMEETESREAAIRGVDARLEDIEKSFDTTFHDLDYARKLYLIENSIFGVDIQPIACQIAKLRFFISLLVDQKSDKIIRPLPNLETRLVAANALVPIEKQVDQQLFFETDQVKSLRLELQQVRHAHFNARTPEAKQRAKAKDADLRLQLASALEELGMSNQTASLLAGWDPYDQNTHALFFDPAWMFSLSKDDFKGFDIVIGNPPYVRQEKIKELKPQLKDVYDCYSGAADLYVYFYERGIQLLDEGGVFSFITSNKWMRSGYGLKLRDYLKTNTRVDRLIDFGDADIFEAIAYPCIAVLTKASALAGSKFKALNWNQEEWQVEDVAEHLSNDTFLMLQSDLTSAAWHLASAAKLGLQAQIKSAGTPLGEYVGGRLYRGILTGLNEAFVVSRAQRDDLIERDESSQKLLKPFLRGRDIKRWSVESDDLYLIRIESSENVRHPWSDKEQAIAEKIFAKAYPAIYEFMKPMRKELVSRCDQGKFFWELRSCAYWEEFEQNKIVLPAITDSVNFAGDSKGFYSNDKTSIIVPESVPYLLAILNSQVTWWLVQQSFASRQGGFFEFKPMYVSQLPIPSTGPDNTRCIEALARSLMEMGGVGPAYAYLERLLNALVYQLFFPDLFAENDLNFFGLVRKASLPDGMEPEAWNSFHQVISEVNHPINAALFGLNGLEVIRIIEGRE